MFLIRKATDKVSYAAFNSALSKLSCRIAENHNIIKNIEKTLDPLYKCEVCNCLVSGAVKGKPEIRQCNGEDYIYYPHYCKIHAPAEE